MKKLLTLRSLCTPIAHFGKCKFCTKTERPAADPRLVSAAIQACTPSSLTKLVNSLISETILHQPGKFVIVNKPYGLSCVGYKQKDGGVFRNSRHDRRGGGVDDDETTNASSQAPSTSVTLQDALPFLAEHYREPNLSFCCGIKRYASGPVVLPSSREDFQNLINSLKRINIASPFYGFRHRALALCVGRPANETGVVTGYSTFTDVFDHREYVFVSGGKAKLRARTGKYAVAGCMNYQLLASNYGCSLIDITFPKFARHLPRLMLTEILCPVLGDPLYMNRVVEVDSAPFLITPQQVHRITKHQRRKMTSFLNRLGFSSRDEIYRLPMYFHIYQTVFARYGPMVSNDERVDLHASAPLPEHMVAMLKCLGLFDAAIEHLQRCETEEQSEQGTVSGETKF